MLPISNETCFHCLSTSVLDCFKWDNGSSCSSHSSQWNAWRARIHFRDLSLFSPMGQLRGSFFAAFFLGRMDKSIWIFETVYSWWNWKLELIVPACCTRRKNSLKKNILNIAYMNWNSFHFMRSKKTTMCWRQPKEIHSFIHSLLTTDYNVLCCVRLFWSYFYFSYTMHNSVWPLCERFPKQIENKLKNSLCVCVHFRFCFVHVFDSISILPKRQKSNG